MRWLVHRVMAISAVVALSVAGMTGAAVYAVPPPTPDADASYAEAEATTEVVCPVPARTVITFRDGDEVVNEQAFQRSEAIESVVPATPQHEGRNFIGWFYADVEGNATNERFDPANVDVDGHGVNDGNDTRVTVVAGYDDSPIVTFYKGDEVYATMRIPSGESIEKTEDGEVIRDAPGVSADSSRDFFDGWTTDRAGGTPFSTTEPVTRDLNLFANFKRGRLAVFDTHGGSSVTPRGVDEGNNLDPASIDEPTKAGYTFAHWSLTEDGPAFEAADTPDSNFTLHAVWTPATAVYAAVFMRETTEGGSYVVDSIMTLEDTTESTIDPAKAVERKEAEGGITENSLVTSGDSPIRFVYNAERTKAEETTIRGDGESVQRIYYDRPRHDLTFRAQMNPAVRRWEDRACSRPFCRQKIIEHTYKDVIAGTDLGSYFEDFRKKHADAVRAADEYADQWARYWHPDSETKETLRINFSENTRGTPFYANAPKMPGRDFDLYLSNYAEDYKYTIEYVEVPEDNHGTLKEPYSPYGPDQLLASGTVLKRGLIPDATFFSLRNAQMTLEDYPPIVGFKTIETQSPNNHWTDVKTDPSGKTRHGIVRYVRLSYPIDFVTRDERKLQNISVPFETNLAEVMPKDYVVGKTRRASDGAVFGGWYLDEKFAGKPVHEIVQHMPAHGLVMYAKWIPRTVEVRYHEWDKKNLLAGEIYQTDTYKYEDRLESLAEPHVPDGRDRDDFSGWIYRTPRGWWVTARPGMVLTRDYDFYPLWPGTRRRVAYHLGEGSGEAPVDPIGYHPTATGLALAGPRVEPPAGKVFLGWRVRGDESEKILYPGDIFDLVHVTDNNRVNLDAVYGPAPAAGRLIYDPNGADAERVGADYDANAIADVASEDTFTRPGYTFEGWATSPDGPALDCGPGSQVLVPPGTSVLYALWSAQSVAITVQKVDREGTPIDGAEFDVIRQTTSGPDLNVMATHPEGQVGVTRFEGVPMSEPLWLVETKAPEGYELLPVPVGFTISDGVITLDDPDMAPYVQVDGLSMSVQDVPAGHLPAAGGAGHLPYYLAGLCLVVLGVVWRRQLISV